MVGEAKQREDGSYEVTFQNLKHDMPGMAKAEQDVTIWFPKSYVKKLK